MLKDEHGMQRRVAGWHDIRMDGMTDLVMRARGATVMDLGCNRGLVGLEFAINGAAAIHGCDYNADAIYCAKNNFADLRFVKSHFEVLDLTGGPKALAPFGDTRYDIVLMLAVYHKIKRAMAPELLSELMRDIGHRTLGYLAWRATSDKPAENEQEIVALDRDLGETGLRRIHTSYISKELGVCAIWALE